MSEPAAATTKVISPVGIASYPYVATPQSPRPGSTANPKYSMTVIFKPGTDLSALKAAANAAAESAYPGKGIALLAKGTLRSPFRTDCEAKNYKDCATFINVRTDKKPGVVYAYKDATTGKPALIPDDKIADEIYPGCQVKVSLNAFAYNTDGNKGISFGLNNVQKIGEGERLDGRAAADDEFTADLSQAPDEDLPF